MLKFRIATIDDVDLYFKWANDPVVRSNSYHSEPIKYEDHVTWFSQKLNDPNFSFYVFFNEEGLAVGQVRIQKEETETVIGISIDKDHRGKSLGLEMLEKATDDFLSKNPNEVIYAYIKKENISSIKIFSKAGFQNPEECDVSGIPSYRYIKTI